jgi:hypothetical protein
LKKVDDEYHERNNQQNVHEVARDAKSEPQCPHQQQDDQDGPQHKSPHKEGKRSTGVRFIALKPVDCGHFAPRKTKKADVDKHLKVFVHVGLLVNEPPGTSGLLFI